MKKRDKACGKANPEAPKRKQRIACLMSEEELRIVSRYLGKIQDNEQITLVQRDCAHVCPQEHGGRLSYIVRRT